MDIDKFSSEPILAKLKDFQRRTVDYVFHRFYGPDHTSRFLVADEVGLGKTLVARGLIAKTIEHLRQNTPRIDIVYICSNAAIAQQNINRLNVCEGDNFALASRLTLLPTQVHELKNNRVNFVSFTPSTALDLKGQSGWVRERAIIYWILSTESWARGAGFRNLLQGDCSYNNWISYIYNKKNVEIDTALADDFRQAVNNSPILLERVAKGIEQFHRFKENIPSDDAILRNEIVGQLRQTLASVCLNALEPELVILDEFQRFKDILDGDNDAAELAKQLFNYKGVRTLLLSATPYKMLSLDHEREDDHYPDFIRTVNFLYDNPAKVADLKSNIQSYRQLLYTIGNGNHEQIVHTRDSIQSTLLKVMCRTERIGMTQQLDAMVTESTICSNLNPNDLLHAADAASMAKLLGTRDIIEYWKSVPYLFNYLKEYDFGRKLEKELASGNNCVSDIFTNAKGQVLNADTFEKRSPVEPANARMRTLFANTLDKGQWKFLWMPPSLTYSQHSGYYAGAESFTKSLVFSAWNAVPDAIATLCSYEAERRMLAMINKPFTYGEINKKFSRLLELKLANGEAANMATLPLLIPSPTLASVIDPLAITLEKGQGCPITTDALLMAAKEQCDQLLQQLPAGTDGSRVDERWYWVAPALLDSTTGLRQWCENKNNRSDDETEDGHKALSEHIRRLAEAISGHFSLGPRPHDLALVLAYQAIASPATCALRALRRIAPTMPFDNSDILTASYKIARGFQTMFNSPEAIALLKNMDDDSYWTVVYQYCLDGNLQSLLDEQVHILVESQGVADHTDSKKVGAIAEFIQSTVSLRAALLNINESDSTGETFKLRCRFALRFGEFRNDQDAGVIRATLVRDAFNSPFRPFILASTSIGQEGLDFHTWCHSIVHWNLPSNPVDLEQREGRIHRYKGHAVRKNVALKFGLKVLSQWDRKGDPWTVLFQHAKDTRPENSSDLVPYWIFETEGGCRIERNVPMLPFSREIQQLSRLKKCLALYRLVFGQPRQEDLLMHLADKINPESVQNIISTYRISLHPPR